MHHHGVAALDARGRLRLRPPVLSYQEVTVPALQPPRTHVCRTRLPRATPHTHQSDAVRRSPRRRLRVLGFRRRRPPRHQCRPRPTNLGSAGRLRRGGDGRDRCGAAPGHPARGRRRHLGRQLQLPPPPPAQQARRCRCPKQPRRSQYERTSQRNGQSRPGARAAPGRRRQRRWTRRRPTAQPLRPRRGAPRRPRVRPRTRSGRRACARGPPRRAPRWRRRRARLSTAHPQRAERHPQLRDRREPRALHASARASGPRRPPVVQIRGRVPSS